MIAVATWKLVTLMLLAFAYGYLLASRRLGRKIDFLRTIIAQQNKVASLYEGDNDD